jgi:4-hydroxy 2-oxovalerate aldolase
MDKINLLDCTLRDGGYYNAWDFDKSIIEKYLKAMEEISVDFVELGLRSFDNKGFKGACAYTTDNFIETLVVPKGLNLGVMVNANELLKHPKSIEGALSELFVPASESPINLVRIACHVHEFEEALIASLWLKKHGYIVGYNLMQIAERSVKEIKSLATTANSYPIDILYFADSLGSLNPEKTSEIIKVIREVWQRPLGIHTHDNMGYALANSMRAAEEGVTWIDGTVTGMGRGPGNAKTEYLAIELDSYRQVPCNILPLMELIEKTFKPMQQKYGWGTNTYYYLAGKYGIHPTYIQEMLSDSKYNEEDVISVIEHLKKNGGNKFSIDNLKDAQKFYSGQPSGDWYPKELLMDREVLILGTGPGVINHLEAIEEYIKQKKPVVIALNAKSHICSDLIDIRVACHPVRLLADYSEHIKLPQPLVTPASMLPEYILEPLKRKELLDFGIIVGEKEFIFEDNYCVLPNSLVITYALAIATSGKASRILLAGFDGYEAGDSRNAEMTEIFNLYNKNKDSLPLTSITPTCYQINKSSIYQMISRSMNSNDLNFLK